MHARACAHVHTRACTLELIADSADSECNQCNNGKSEMETLLQNTYHRGEEENEKLQEKAK